MPSNRRHFIHNTVTEICFRAQQGLILPAIPLIKEILQGIIARAQTLYPVTICHYITMANHMHMLLVVQNPEDVPLFVGYIKRESAHAINRLLGRRRFTVWVDDYDSPTVLDAEKTLSRIVYFYTNPQKAGLVERIQDYPHLSSWGAFLSGKGEYSVRYYPRTSIPRIESPQEFLSPSTLHKLRSKSSVRHTLRITPNAWMNCFESSRGVDPKQLRAEVIQRVKELELEFHRARQSKVLGARTLSESVIVLDYMPKKSGAKMICLGTEKSTRATFIAWFKESSARAASAIKDWLKGIRSCVPPGFFVPGGRLHASLNPVFAPLPAG